MTSLNALPPLSVKLGIDNSKKAQATKNAYNKYKELALEMREAKKIKKENKILKNYGENPETGKRSWGKIIFKTFVNSLIFGPVIGIANTVFKMNKADNIQLKREIQELKGEVNECRDPKTIKRDQFIVLHAKDPETGKRPCQAYSSVMATNPIICLLTNKVVDKMAAEQAEIQTPATEEPEVIEVLA